MDRDELRKLIDDDDLGLLNLRTRPAAATADERLITSFREINDFVRRTGKEPNPNKSNVKEMMLHSRLTALREDKTKVEGLREFDEFQLLGEPKAVKTIDDIFSDDDVGILSDVAENIFILKNIPITPKEINLPDYVARRKPCQDFSAFEQLLKQCQIDLHSGKRRIIPFSQETQISVGNFFILKGILLYVAEEGERETTADGKYNARLRCIFENGTEADLLLRSLAASLYKDGRRVSSHADKMLDAIRGATDEDEQTGYIYVLKSLSQKAEIKALRNLFKIGFSRVTVEERIKNAAQQSTYLMAPVAVVSVFQCYNLNAHKFETLLHHFFGSACLSIDVIDGDGRRSVPREWFIAPLDVITMAVNLLITGEIVAYR